MTKKLSKKDFEKDFDYLFEFLKENHPYSHLINFEEIYKLKDKICSCKNRSKFLDNLKIELKQKYLSNIKHFTSLMFSNIEELKRFKPSIYYDFYEYCSKLDCLDLEEFVKDAHFEKSVEEIRNYDNIYNCRIIKYKGKNTIYIKIKDMINPDEKQYNELRDFLIKNKDVDNIFIDLRGNGGGNSDCYVKLLRLIYNGKVGLTKKVKCYFKNTKYNKPWFDYVFAGNKDLKPPMKINELKNNKFGFTHYVENNIFIKDFKNKEFIGYNGNIGLIIDRHCFSSTQMFIDFVQGQERITIYGNEKSKGSGYYGNISTPGHIIMQPFLFVLPNTHIIFMYERFYCEDDKTIPDKPIPKFLMKKEFID